MKCLILLCGAAEVGTVHCAQLIEKQASPAMHLN
jgi:hypothetical protein